MIIWIASYPKSGNTYIRSFLSAYYFTSDGKFNFDLLKNIKQFPNAEFFKGPVNSVDVASDNWLLAQKEIKNDRKIKFLKTHNFLGAYDNKPFTTIEYTLGAVYIIRDPRNVITSVKNHWSFNYDEAYKFMTDANNGTKSDLDDYSTYSHLGTWAEHYKSWATTKNFRKLIIKYEDLENNKYETFRDVIVFLNAISNRTERVNKQKLKNAIESTNFTVLKNLEQNKGFEEALYSKSEKKFKSFFNLGFNNRWKKILPSDITDKIEGSFNKEMKEIGYL
tara:strand:+ start:423 stop:1256 length:834 start_codon:yes stop_codon:yes gene_type:complete